MNTKLDNCTRPTEQNHYILIMELHYLGLRLLVQSGQLGEQILAGVWLAACVEDCTVTLISLEEILQLCCSNTH